MAPPAAETARTVRRLGDEEFVGTSILLDSKPDTVLRWEKDTLLRSFDPSDQCKTGRSTARI
jgi:hypothetical protein